MNMSIADTARRVRGEYAEMPGPSLTPQQAQRLWNLDTSYCAAILDALVDARFLRKTIRGAYVRRDGAPTEGR